MSCCFFPHLLKINLRDRSLTKLSTYCLARLSSLSSARITYVDSQLALGAGDLSAGLFDDTTSVLPLHHLPGPESHLLKSLYLV